MRENDNRDHPKILIIATNACAYPGADYAGQTHAEYATNTYIIRVPAPVIFSEDFYLRCFRKGINGIIIMTCGHECPYEGAYERFAKRIDKVHTLMKEVGIEPKRLKMCAVCTVCARSFLKEINNMNEILREIGAVTPSA
jgi:coenzyme F420-reducing hydrogenase delta subunit